MSIQLVTYANQTVTPTNDAIIYENAIDMNGVFYGCSVTVTSNNVNITGGYGIVCGREFVIQSESIAVTLAPSGTLLGRLYVRLDLADADAPIQLLTATGNTLPSLQKDSNVNYTNGAYELELATFDVGVSSLSNVSMTYPRIKGQKTRGGVLVFPSIAANGYADMTVTYKQPMQTTPSVVGIRSGVGGVGYNLQITVKDNTVEGFTMRVWNYGASAVSPTVNWIAVPRTE